MRARAHRTAPSGDDGAAPLRLAIDAANLARDRRGMGRVARAILTAALHDRSVRVTLLADKRADAAALRAEFPGVAVRHSRAARGRAFDAVWYPFNGMRFVSRAPALVTLHDAFAFTEPHPDVVARFRERTPIRRAARRAALVVTDSQWSRGEIARALGIADDRLRVVAPEPGAFWSPGEPGPLPAGIAGRYALLVGAREARKNVAFAVRACAAALRGADESLVVVGALGPGERALVRASGPRAGEIAATDATLRALYRGASVVLVPSLAEGFGLVAAEALACGAPVVAANASALPEAAGDAALLLSPHDLAAWTVAIRTLFDDPASAERLRARARARFAARDRDRPAREMLALAREVAGAR